MDPQVRFLDPPVSWALRSWDRHPAAELLPDRHQSLLRSEPEKYAQMVQGVTSFGIYLIDRDGVIRSWNRGAANLTGHAREQVLGQPFQMLFVDADVRAGVPRRTLEFVRANHHVRDEQRRARRGGADFLAQIALDALRAASGELLGFVEVFQDITEAKQREERLYQRATRDPLTGVANRGHFTEMAALEIERARRFAEPLSLMLLDIDHFKRVNDTHGHEAGDRVIQTLAQTCVASARKIDLVARLGGEEFAILLPRANKEPAAEMAQRLRRLIGEQRVPIGGGREIAFTVSIGVASLRPTTRDLAELLRNVDAALYKAKREGRNRVELWFE
ncbi:GGDEF domain-containing protein [Sinimarinibacterium thermocellulolyticum]|uniref:Sensor domain-containing diguanylate cyclase n=1 Tax=Sinimarinibacterium thermocellulolyticum TaxID=3170016 RepID=A0ABV2AAR9_9GAMM